MIKISIAQINPIVGDITYNSKVILENVRKARDEGANMLITPELSLTGYPPEDLLLRDGFIEKVDYEIKNLKKLVNDVSSEIIVVVGHPILDQKNNYLINAASVLLSGKIIGNYGKIELPNYSVFDEKRYFQSGKTSCVFKYKDINFGINICEDIWFSKAPKMAKDSGAQVLIVLNASPFCVGKHKERMKVVKENIAKIQLPVIFCNMVGGQDDLIFDGNSFFADENGKLLKKAKQFEEDFISLSINNEIKIESVKIESCEDEITQIFNALVLGTQDFVKKNGFNKVILGLSGGIDSALTLAIAVHALGSQNVEAVMMPSKFTSRQSFIDAKACSNNLGVSLQVIPIENLMKEFDKSLLECFTGFSNDLTEENIQSRIRGVLLMALSNKKKSLLLTTGNKSEIAVGYCTLYGDMCGGYSLLKDVFKTQVYDLAKYLNRVARKEFKQLPIPTSIIEKKPSAELNFNQFDQDSLPPYELLDKILHGFIENNLSYTQLVNFGYPHDAVKKVLNLVRISEFKRRQSAPGARITKSSFGRDWRYPVSNRFSYNGDV